MYKNFLIILLSSILIVAGCVDKKTDSNNKHEQKPIKNVQREENSVNPSIKPIATISYRLNNFTSTNTTISTKVIGKNIVEVEYHIWRTADGLRSMRTFFSMDRGKDFSIFFDTTLFMSQRGEYQVEAYKVNKDRSKEFLARATITLQQHVPILMYHAIDEYKGVGSKYLFVPPANFEAQMRYLKKNGYKLLTFEHWNEVNKVNKPIFVTFDDGMENNMNALRILQKLKDDKFLPTATAFVISSRIDSSPYSLSSNDLKEMVNSGIFSIQSHSVSHVDLTKTANIEVELKASKEKIEQITGKPVIAIAYPFGLYNDKVIQETKKYYKFAVTTIDSSFTESGVQNDMLQMQRIHINNNTNIIKFAKLVNQY